MRHLEINAHVPDQRATDVYSRLCDFERYSEFSSAVRSVKINVSKEGQMISTWETNFRDGILRWVEKDYFDPVTATIAFQQTEGDIEHFSGNWKVEPLNEGALICFTAQFDMGIPSLSKILDPIAEQALRENIIAIIQGLFGNHVEVMPDGVRVNQEQSVG